MTNYSEEELLPLSGIQHIAFCPRQWALIHIERQWAENVRTTEGKLMHEKADDPFIQETRGSLVITRSMPLASHSIGLYGIADVVEFKKASAKGKGVELSGFDGLWVPHPVEYKRGKPKPDQRDKVQLCAQAICLEEMYSIDIADGALYYGETRRREHVDFDEPLREEVHELAKEMHALFRAGTTPCASYSKQCRQCSLMDICMPKMSMKRPSVSKYLEKVLRESTI